GGAGADRVTGALFRKSVAGRDVTLAVRGFLDQVPSSAGQMVAHRGLSVTMVTNGAMPGPGGDAAGLAFDVGLQRNDVQCLRGLNVADATLQPSTAPLLRLGDLCAVIPVPAAKAIAPRSITSRNRTRATASARGWTVPVTPWSF